jgi:YfiH family protein
MIDMMTDFKGPELHFYDLGKMVTAFSTTRKGGVSEGLYGEFNINPFCGDAVEHVSVNRHALCRTLKIEESKLILPHQVHGIESRDIAKEFFSLPVMVQNQLLEGVDCVMTDVTGACIGVSTADCIPVLLYDPVHHAAAAVHAGWRGTLARIVRKAVRDMHVCYQSNPADLLVVIGPGISLDSFEVGQDVYDQFSHAGFDMNAIARMDEKWHIDLSLCNRLQLEAVGVKSEHIDICDICTYLHSDLFFSARRLGADSGRIYTGIIMR